MTVTFRAVDMTGAALATEIHASARATAAQGPRKKEETSEVPGETSGARLAEARRCTPAQLALRWSMDRGLTPIPKATSRATSSPAEAVLVASIVSVPTLD